jgi:hypothetical protein
MVELSQDFKKRATAPKPEQKIFKEIPTGNVKLKLMGIKDNDLTKKENATPENL